jgi:predicted transposase YbfD/YdcC
MIQKFFETLADNRQKTKVRHNLLETVIMTICAVTVGCQFWYQIEEYCQHQIAWFREKLGLTLPYGIPSHDTFQRIFASIEPKEFEKRFTQWVSSICKSTDKEIVSIDGKTLRASRKKGGSPLHLVNAWANKNQLVLGQEATANKSNEITAIPNLLDVLDLNGCIVTIDAMGTQKNIAEKIAEKNDYVLALKGNHGNIHKEVFTYFEETLVDETLYFDQNRLKTLEKSHGRIEKRAYYLSTDIDWLDGRTEWTGLKAIGAVWSETIRDGKPVRQERYYLTTLETVEEFAQAARAHWGIENSLHWRLDVLFNEDRSRSFKGHTAQNFSVIRKMVLNILKNYPTEKPTSLNAKRLRCQFNFDFLADILLSVFTSP